VGCLDCSASDIAQLYAACPYTACIQLVHWLACKYVETTSKQYMPKINGEPEQQQNYTRNYNLLIFIITLTRPDETVTEIVKREVTYIPISDNRLHFFSYMIIANDVI
jgi:hypothetical protein